MLRWPIHRRRARAASFITAYLLRGATYRAVQPQKSKKQAPTSVSSCQKVSEGLLAKAHRPRRAPTSIKSRARALISNTAKPHKAPRHKTDATKPRPRASPPPARDLIRPPPTDDTRAAADRAAAQAFDDTAKKPSHVPRARRRGARPRPRGRRAAAIFCVGDGCRPRARGEDGRHLAQSVSRPNSFAGRQIVLET